MTESSSIEDNIKVEKLTESDIPKKFNYMKNKVAIVKLDDYNSESISNALKELIKILNLEGFFKNKSILIKPNLLAPTKNAFTPPELVYELIKLIKNDTKEIMIGDSTMTKKLTNITLKRCKINEGCEELGAKALNFFECNRIKVDIFNPNYEVEKSIYLPQEVCEANLIINMPKLKTHNGFVYTGAIKNFFGLLGNKMNMHMTHKNKINFQKMLADIYFAVEETNKTDFPKVLTIMDAVIAMEGKGPRSGKPRKIGVLIAGFNSAAVDIVGYTLMNGNPADLEAINSLARRTNLTVDINQLEIIGINNYRNFIIKDFKKPSVSIFRKSQTPSTGILSKIVNKAMSISIKIKRKKCVLCEQCVKHCPAEAMFKKNDKIMIDHDKCIECFCCGESCPNDAISAKWYVFRILPILLILMAFGVFTIIWLLIQIIVKII
ncbi:MAG: DUF362 domain-containing protein [Promethearchaeota archaeon]